MSRMGLRREKEETFFWSFLFRILFSIKELKKIGTNYVRKTFLSMDVKIKMWRDGGQVTWLFNVSPPPP